MVLKLPTIQGIRRREALAAGNQTLIQGESVPAECSPSGGARTTVSENRRGMRAVLARTRTNGEYRDSNLRSAKGCVSKPRTRSRPLENGRARGDCLGNRGGRQNRLQKKPLLRAGRSLL